MHSRIMLTSDDFRALVSGRIVERRINHLPARSDEISIALTDMGHNDMMYYVDQAGDAAVKKYQNSLKVDASNAKGVDSEHEQNHT